MYDFPKFYIDGKWTDPAIAKRLAVINPANEQIAGYISLGSAQDVDRAVAAARRAFPSFSATSVVERGKLLQTLLEQYQARKSDLAHDRFIQRSAADDEHAVGGRDFPARDELAQHIAIKSGHHVTHGGDLPQPARG